MQTPGFIKQRYVYVTTRVFGGSITYLCKIQTMGLCKRTVDIRDKNFCSLKIMFMFITVFDTGSLNYTIDFVFTK